MAIPLYGVVGGDLAATLLVTDGDEPADLTDAAVTWMAKRRIDDEDEAAVVTASTDGDTIVVDGPPASGTITIAVPASEMAAVPPGAYAWTLEAVVGTRVLRFPDGRHGGPGRLYVSPSAIVGGDGGE